MNRLRRVLSVAAFILAFPVIAGIFMLGWAMINSEDRERWRQRILDRKKRVIIVVGRRRT